MNGQFSFRSGKMGVAWLALLWCMLCGAGVARSEVPVMLTQPSFSTTTGSSMYTLKARTDDETAVQVMSMSFDYSREVKSLNFGTVTVESGQTLELNCDLMSLGTAISSTVEASVTGLDGASVEGVKIELVSPSGARTLLKNFEEGDGNFMYQAWTQGGPGVQGQPLSGTWKMVFTSAIGRFRISDPGLSLRSDWFEAGRDVDNVPDANGDWSFDWNVKAVGPGLYHLRAVASEGASGPYSLSSSNTLTVEKPDVTLISPVDSSEVRADTQQVVARVANGGTLTRVRFEAQEDSAYILFSNFSEDLSDNATKTFTATLSRPSFRNVLITEVPTLTIELAHTRIADLSAALVAPDGTRIPLFTNTLTGTSFSQEIPLPQLVGKAYNGEYELEVIDNATGETGTLERAYILADAPRTLIGYDDTPGGANGDEFSQTWNVPVLQGGIDVLATAETVAGDMGVDSNNVYSMLGTFKGQITGTLPSNIYVLSVIVEQNGRHITRVGIDEDGKWELNSSYDPLIPGQQYDLRVEATGYLSNPLKRTVTATRHEISGLDFVLSTENTLPAVSITRPLPNQTYSRLSQITGTASDAPAGMMRVNVEVKRDNDILVPPAHSSTGDWQWRPWSFYDENAFPAITSNEWANWNFPLPPSLSEARYSVIVSAFDNANNRRYASLYFHINANGINGDALGLSLSASTCSEAAGANAITGTISLPSAQNSDTVIGLNSSNPNKLTVPATVTIPAGQLSATFAITAIDNSIADATANVTISVSHPTLGGATQIVSVTNDDVTPTPTPTATTTPTAVPTATPLPAPLAFIVVPSPREVTEIDNSNALSLGISRRNTDLTQPLTVTLTSSEPTALSLPASATFNSGQSIISVPVASHDDTIASGNRTITLSVVGTDAAGSSAQANSNISFLDPDRAGLQLIADRIDLSSNQPEATLTVSRITTVPVTQAPPLTVTLSNSNPLLLNAPTSVVIPAGAGQATFTVRLQSNLAGVQDVVARLTALATGLEPVSLTFNAALPLEFNGPKLPLNLNGSRTYLINVPVGQPHLWVTLQSREVSNRVQATLRRGTTVLDRSTEWGDSLLHVANPPAGSYSLELSVQSGIAMVWVGSNLPALTTTRTYNGTVYANDGLDWVQLDIPSGVKRVDLSLEPLGNVSRLELFAASDLSNALARGEHWFNPPVNISHENPPAGRYIVRVMDHGTTAESGTEVRPYSLSAKFTLATTPPRAQGITPNKGSNTGDVTTEIVGENLDPASTVKLVQGGRIITANKVSSGGVSDGSRLIAGFSLAGTTPGVYSVIVTSPSGRTFTLANAFTIVANGTPELWHELVARAKIRIGRDQTFTLHFGNRGTSDAYGVPFMVSGIPLNANVTAAFESMPAPEGTETTPLDQAPTTVRRAADQVLAVWVPFIPAGSESSFTFKINATTATPFTLTAVRMGGLFGEGTNNAKMAGSECCGTPDGKTNGAGVGKNLDYDQANCIGKVAKFVLNKFLGLALGPGCLEGGVNLAMAAAQNWEQYARDKYFDAGGNEQKRRVDLFGNMMQMLPDISKTLIQCAGAATPFGKALTIANEILTLLNDINQAKQLGEECGDAFAPSDATSSPVSPVNAYDPNDKVGPRGVGAQRYISGLDPMPYTIFFENKATATAPAEQVFITDQLDKTKYDLSTFSLGTITFADRSVTPPPGLKEWSTTVDMRPAKPIVVQITGSLNETTGLVRWVFSSIDPETGLAPEDPDAAFLNPNRRSPEGEGSVSFVIAAKRNLPTLSRIANQARIVFDTNAHIDTPVWSNLTDAVKPTSRVLALITMQNAHRFLVKWSGSDVGAGVRNYTIYVSDNGGRSYRIWQRDTTATQAVFLGDAGKTYLFYSVATDKAGNEELRPGTPDARTTVAAADLSVTMTAVPAAPRTRSPITYTLTVQNAGPQPAAQVLVRQTLPIGATFTSASATVGRPTRSGNFVLLTVPTLARGARVVMTTIVSAPQGARLETVAAANGPTPDPNTANNEVTLRTVVPPFIEWATPANRATINSMNAVTGFAFAVPGVSTGAPSRVEVVITRNSDRKSWTGTTWGVRTPLSTTLQVLAGRSSWTRTNTANTPLPNGANLLEGLYTLEAKLFDRSGESSTSTIVVTVDKTAPATVTVSRPLANAIVRTVAPITGTATDNVPGSGIANVQVVLQRVRDNRYWNGIAWVSAVVANAPKITAEFGLPVAGRVTWSRATSLPEGRNLLSGLYAVTPIVTDGAGNIKTGTPIRFTVDATVPTISITAPLNNSSATTLTRATGRTVDNAGGSGLARVEVFLQRQSDEKFWTGTRWGARTALPATLASGVWTRATGFPAAANLLTGDYTLQAHAVDRAGNRAVAVSTFRITPSNLAPRDVEAQPTTKAPRSTVALSSLGVRSSDSSVVLSFTAPLDASVARDAAHYTVEINGERADIEAIELNGQTVTLALGEGTIRSGDRVRVTWNDLLDISGRTLSGGAGPISAR